jgi:hypothetical protein
VVSTRAKTRQQTTEESQLTTKKREATTKQSQVAAKQEAPDRGEGVRTRGGKASTCHNDRNGTSGDWNKSHSEG